MEEDQSATHKVRLLNNKNQRFNYDPIWEAFLVPYIQDFHKNCMLFHLSQFMVYLIQNPPLWHALQYPSRCSQVWCLYTKYLDYAILTDLNIFLQYKSLPIPPTFAYISSVKKKVLLPNKIPIRTQQIIYSQMHRLDVEGMDYLEVS